MQDSDPAPQNIDEGKDQETTSFSRKQVNKIVSKRLAEANPKANLKAKKQSPYILKLAVRPSRASIYEAASCQITT